jgi:uncharacterized protein (DUF952 family)
MVLSFIMLLFVSFTFVSQVKAETETEVVYKQEIDYMPFQWILDEEQGYIYAISNGTMGEQNTKLLFIRLSDLQIEKELELSSNVSDIELQQDKLYIASSRTIQVVNTSTQSIEKTLELGQEPDKIAVDGHKLFYTVTWNSSVEQHPGPKLYEYHLLEEVVKEVPFGRDYDDHEYSTPDLAVDRDNHVLYIAESERSAHIEAMSTDDYTRIDQYHSDEIDSNYSTVIFDDHDVFYAGQRMDGSNLGNITGDYYDQNIVYVKDKYVFTRQAIFDRDTAKKILTLPGRPGVEYSGPFLVDRFGHIYMIITEVGEFELRKLILKNEPKKNDNENDREQNSGDVMFKDIQNHWAKEDIDLLASANLVNGMSDSIFAPAQDVTRAQYVTLLSRGLKLSPTTVGSTFKDVNNRTWYTAPIQAAVDAGIAKGYHDGTFKPHQNITRQELVVMTSRALEYLNGEQEADISVLESFLDHENIANWAKSASAVAIKNGLIQGYSEGQFAPKELANRAQSAVILKRLLLNSEKKDELISSVEGYQMGKYAQLASDKRTDLTFTLSEPRESVGVSLVSIANDVTGQKHEIGPSSSPRSFGWDGKTYEFDVYPDLVPGTTYVVTYYVSFPYGKQTFEKKVTVPTDHINIHSVTALNASQLNVKFNESVDIVSGESIENYQIIDSKGIVPLKNAVRQNSVFGDNVILNLARPIADQAVIHVSAKGIKSRADARLFPPFEKEILVMGDQTKPKLAFPPGHGKQYIVEHDGESYTSLALYFSEPIKSGTIKIDGVTVGEATGESVVLSGLNLDGNEWHTVTLEKLTDTAGNVSNYSFGFQPINYDSSFGTEVSN